MFYNIDFFFEKPIRFFYTEEATDFTVSAEDFNLYLTGDYIKGPDGVPQKQPGKMVSEHEIKMSDRELLNLEAFAEITESLAETTAIVLELKEKLNG